jgi:hypothetical protein
VFFDTAANTRTSLTCLLAIAGYVVSWPVGHALGWSIADVAATAAMAQIVLWSAAGIGWDRRLLPMPLVTALGLAGLLSFPDHAWAWLALGAAGGPALVGLAWLRFRSPGAQSRARA